MEMIYTTIRDMQGFRAPRDHGLALYRTRSCVGLEKLSGFVTWGIHLPLTPEHPDPAETGSRDPRKSPHHPGGRHPGSPDLLFSSRPSCPDHVGKDPTQLLIYCPVAFINMKVKPEDSLKIENIVASAKVTDYLDLPALASQIKDAEYNKKRFPGVVIRMQNPKIAALVFGSGKVILTGAKSIDSLSEGLEILGNLLRDLKIDISQNLTYKIQNIVTSADLGSGINLNKIAVGFNLDRIEYEPEQFPGLVYRLENPKVVVLLFGSGKLIITGGKEPEDAKKAVQKILNDLKNLGLL
jgi:transcription initiation factor TFIID TATA-box-binding protein